MKTLANMLSVLLVFTFSAHAQSTHIGKGQGAIVITDGAALYKDSEGEEAYPTKLEKGDAVGGMTKLGRMVTNYQFQEEHGRVRALSLSKTGTATNGWMNRADLSSYFTYECGCGLVNAQCSPHALERFHYKWNICFVEAREKKLADMAAAQAVTLDAATAEPSSESVETRLKKLNDLYDKGLITKEEFEKKRAEILGKM